MLPTYNTYTYNSPNIVLRYFQRKRFLDSLKLLDIKPGITLLDYGCGDGRLLQICKDQVPDQNLFGFEPAGSLIKEAMNCLKSTKIKISNRLDRLPLFFDRIACLEVCEHLPEVELECLILRIKERMLQESIVVFSVPIETGLSGFLKNIYRLAKDRKKDNLSLFKLYQTFFGGSIAREIGEIESGFPYYYSHVGFNHKKFEKVIAQNLKILQKEYSPLNALRLGLFQNCVFYVCSKL